MIARNQIERPTKDKTRQSSCKQQHFPTMF